ncbi:MAG TPA: outer membrane beta-barrel protein [Anaeromyxobacteraceae bacterium]
MKPTLAAALAAAAFASFPARATAGDTYLVLKGGYYGPTKDIAFAQATGTKLDPKFYGELGAGTNLVFLGVELTAGYMSSSTGVPGLTLKVSSIPVLLTAKLRLPVPVVTPYVELGAGAYFNTVDVTGLASEKHTTFGFHVGAGIDLRISSLLLGLEARYLSADAGIPNVTLRVDGVTVTANLGFYL